MIVTASLYDIWDRKYIDIDGTIVKVPWRYNRPMIKVHGIKTIFEYRVGDTINAEFVTVMGYKVLKSITD